MHQYRGALGYNLTIRQHQGWYLLTRIYLAIFLGILVAL
jgi:hypothetical protein